MNATTTIHSGTIQMKRSHLVGLVVGVVALSVALTTAAASGPRLEHQPGERGAQLRRGCRRDDA